MDGDGYEAVIGLEVHTHLLTQSKLFCGCSAAFGAGPNENVCPVCMGMPGVLPVLNRHAVELAIRAGLAAHCEIAHESIFARKSYFYPDLPKGYQISQYELPLCIGGYIDLPGMSDATGRGACAWCASTWKRTPARISTSRTAAWSISTARRCRWSRSSASPISARPKRQAPTCANCAESCARSMPPTARWRKAPCAATSISRCGPKAATGVRHQDRNQEPELVPFRREGDRIRGRASDRDDRRRAAASLQETHLWDPGARGNAPDALEGVRQRLPLFPRARPATAARDWRMDRGDQVRDARVAGGKARALYTRNRADGIRGGAS